RHPEHPLLEALGRGDYLAYVRPLLEEREQAHLPPITALALLRAEAHQAELARDFLAKAALRLRTDGIEVMGPLPGVMARRAGYWRFQLWVQAASRARLANHLNARLSLIHDLPEARKVRWHVDVDPIEL